MFRTVARIVFIVGGTAAAATALVIGASGDKFFTFVFAMESGAWFFFALEATDRMSGGRRR